MAFLVLVAPLVLGFVHRNDLVVGVGERTAQREDQIFGESFVVVDRDVYAAVVHLTNVAPRGDARHAERRG